MILNQSGSPIGNILIQKKTKFALYNICFLKKKN